MKIKKLRPLSKKTVLASKYYYTCVNVLVLTFSRKFITWKLSPDWVFHKNLSGKYLSCFESCCCLLNMSSFCTGSISWCCYSVVPLVFLLLHYSVIFWLFRQCFRCYASVSVPPVFRQCSASVLLFRIPLFRVPVFVVL